MRRSEKQIRDQALIEKILLTAPYCQIAMVDRRKAYLVAMNYAYYDGSIYLHGAKEGRKAGIWSNGADVTLQIVTQVELNLKPGDPFPECAYYSLFAEGRIKRLRNDKQRREGLDILIDKYGGSKDYSADWHRVEVWRIDIIGEIIGKQSGHNEG
ncbi:MAG: pyridoxamine 5'-phosphate oxidase family protein [Clostridiales bacterium]|jgi:nitroimidazol reductase NimA-like FMN-containing flavoprotein (pyridoxamine 5'-phosphate oxidase superfamily)|nr:pyridoxamine 5'-phosphate oxidase family protein [Clostridiales bacterium]